MLADLSHVEDSHCQSLVAQDGAILIALPPLQHNLQPVGVPLEEMRILSTERTNTSGRVRLSHFFPQYSQTYVFTAAAL